MPNLYIALEHEIGLESPDFVETLKEWFEDLSEEAGVSLMRFFGQNPADFFDEDDLGDAAVGARWFAPEGGIATIDVLVECLTNDTSSRAHRARNELLEMRDLLQAAIAHKTRFHIALDI